MKKVCCLALAIMLILTAFTALAEGTAVNEMPIVTEPVTLTVGIPEQARVPSYDDNDFTRFLEENTGIDLEFVILPSKDTAAKIKLMFASDDLPDVFMGSSLDKPTLYDYGAQGLVLPMNDYIAQYGENFNNMIATCANQFMLSLCTAPDGNIYYLPCVVEEYHGVYQERCWIYQPWLDALNLEMPTTTDEFVTVLKAFRDDDPNGNGEQDEIPLTCQSGAYMVRFFMNSFIYWDSTDHMIVKEDGSVSPAYFEPEFKEGLEWLHMLAEEKLLDIATFTQDSSTLAALLNAETPVVGVCPHQWLDGGFVDTGSQRRFDLAFMGPLTGPEGVRWSVTHPGDPSIGMYITYKCDKPEIAFRLGDYMMNTDISMLNRYGFEGRDWVKVEGDEESLYGDKAVWKDIAEIWQLSSQTISWRRVGPHFHPLGTFESLSAADPKMNYNKLLVRTAKELDGLQPEAYVPSSLAMNAEETEVYTELRPSINSYLDENIAKFIVGDRDFSEWDAFIAEFQNMGIDDFVDSINTCYARMSAQ